MRPHDISPKILHKDSSDDVLLNRYRPALPLHLSGVACDVLHQMGGASVLAHYDPMPGQAGTFVLGVPHCSDPYMTPAETRTVIDDAWNRVRAVPYQVIGGEGCATLTAAIEDFERIVRKIRSENPSLLRHFCSSSYELINRADHYFFYRKEHEHVPGVMLIEAQRQAVYAHLYLHTLHQRGGVTVSLNKLTSEFHGYVELMYPVELVVDDLSADQSLTPRKIDYRVSMFQRGRIVAVIQTEASVIEMRRFERMRNIFIHAPADDWYAPICDEKVRCGVTTADNRQFEVQVVGVSRFGVIYSSQDAPVGDVKRMSLRSSGGMIFDCDVELERHQGGNVLCRFVGVDSNLLGKVGEIIKRGFEVMPLKLSN